MRANADTSADTTAGARRPTLVVSIFAWLNALLAFVAALLTAAPFTPALVLFAILMPVAAVLARLGAAAQGAAALTALALGLWVAPGLFLQPPHPVPAPAVLWALWTLASALAALWFVVRWRRHPESPDTHG